MNNEKEEVVSEELGTEPEVHEEVHDEKKKHHKNKQ